MTARLNILLVDADSHNEFPNLALMKISTYHKQRGDSIDLIRGIPTTAPLVEYDRVYLSCIFFQNQKKARDYLALFPEKTELQFGGSGFLPDFNVRLGSAIEHLKPDYGLYGIDYSIGFTSRGCKRKCPWCVVPLKEGKIKDHAPITEFLDPEHKRVILLDNNFQTSPKWKSNLQYIIDHDLEVNFSQGLDIRLVTKEFADMLSRSRFMTRRFNTRRVHFAFDSIKYQKAFLRGFNLLVEAGIRPASIMIYILVGFDSTIEQDIARVEIVRELGGDPFVMRYNRTKGDHDILFHYARYVNRRIYRNVEAFHDYDYAKSQKAIKAVFGDRPTPDWAGSGCPQGAYAWANRLLEEREKSDPHKQSDL